MRKTGLFLFCCTLITLLSACSDSDDSDDSGESQQVVEASIDQASYILSGKNDGDHDNDQDERELLQVDLQVKNVSDSSVHIVPTGDIQLFDGDSQREPNILVNERVGLRSTSGEKIAANKKTNMTVFFDVEKGEAYKINISPLSSDNDIEAEDVLLDLDTSDYEESFDALQDPGKALKAYIEQLYFDKENSDYEELVSADKNNVQTAARNQFEKGMDISVIEEGVSSDKMDQYYDSFKQASADKSEIKPDVEAKTDDQALVDIDYDAIAMDDISEKIDDYKEKYREKHDSHDVKKEEEYALSKFDSILDDLETKSSIDGLEIKMKKEDGKWTLDDSGNPADRLNRAFARASNF